jgi:hypothetical protein
MQPLHKPGSAAAEASGSASAIGIGSASRTTNASLKSQHDERKSGRRAYASGLGTATGAARIPVRRLKAMIPKKRIVKLYCERGRLGNVEE